MSLKEKTLSGIIWTIADTFFLKGITFIASLILARMLGPTEFGLIGMVSVFLSIGVTLVNSGLSSSIIRTKNIDETDYNTVFYLNLIISFLVFIVFYFIAPFIADFYSQNTLTIIIRYYCVSFIISAFSSIQLAILTKEMKFKKIMLINIPGTLLGILFGICLGYFGFGVFSVVYMYLITQILNSITLWLFSSWKPKYIFSYEKMRFHLGFGYKLMLSGLLNTIFNNLYNIVIGKFFNLQILGFYERSRAFSDYPVNILTSVIGKVTYPLLSNLQDQQARIANVYKNLLQFSFFITAPLMFGAAAIAYPLFDLILGDKWLPAAQYFQIICLASMFYPIHAFNINILKVYGRSDLFLKLEIIKKVVLVLGIVIAFHFGILGLVWSSVFTSFISLLINMYYCSEMIEYKTFQQLKDMLPTFLSGLFTFLIMNQIVNYFDGLPSFLKILISIFFGMLFYISLNFFLKSIPFFFILNLIKNKRI